MSATVGLPRICAGFALCAVQTRADLLRCECVVFAGSVMFASKTMDDEEDEKEVPTQIKRKDESKHVRDRSPQIGSDSCQFIFVA
jgi:hypothetical protein